MGSSRSKKPAARARPSASRVSTAPAVTVPLEERRQRVAQAAYLRAEKRGFVPGHELDDWLQAEADVDRELERAAAQGG